MSSLSFSESEKIQNKQKNRARSNDRADGPSELFLAFWEVYPRKVARAEAWKAWKQVGAESFAGKVTQAIVTQTAADFRHRPEDKIPHAASWLRGERWTDAVRKNGTTPRSTLNTDLDLRP